MALVNRWFRFTIQPILYKHIDVRGQPRRTIKLFTTLSCYPELAALVRSVQSVDLAPFASSKLVRFVRRIGGSRLVGTATPRQLLFTLKMRSFPHMVNNETFHFGEWSRGWGSVPLPQFSSDMPLRTIIVSRPSWTIEREFINLLRGLIRKHHKITRLELPCRFTILKLNEDDIPNLEVFAGEPRLACRVVPNRPVWHLTLKPTSQDFLTFYEEIIQTLARSKSAIACLIIDFFWFFVDEPRLAGGLVDPVARYHPNLVHFSLMGKVNEAIWETTIKHLPENIATMRSLETIDLGRCYIAPSQLLVFRCPNHRGSNAVLKKWGISCPSLKCILFPGGCRWQRIHGGDDWEVTCKDRLVSWPSLPLPGDIPSADIPGFASDLPKPPWWSVLRAGKGAF